MWTCILCPWGQCSWRAYCAITLVLCRINSWPQTHKINRNAIAWLPTFPGPWWQYTTVGVVICLCAMHGKLWQHTDRQRYKTSIIQQRNTYLMHTMRTESLPCASRATDAVRNPWISVNILATYLTVQSQDAKVDFHLAVGYSRLQRSCFATALLLFWRMIQTSRKSLHIMLQYNFDLS